MPLYTYEHPENGKTIDLIQSMNDKHIYVDDSGLKWNRVFYSPQTSIDAEIDPFDKQAFKDKTNNKKGTYGDFLDKSKELSQKRKDKCGYDPIQKKFFKEYSSKRRGVKHPLDRD